MRILRSIHELDVSAFHWFWNQQHSKALITFSRWSSKTGDGALYVLVGIAAMLAQEWTVAKVLAIGFLVERCSYFIFKTGFKRNRPQAALPDFHSVIEPSDQFSFPSGHTSAAFFMATAASFFFPASAIVLYPWACSVGFARVALGVHFPSDILAGAVMGHLICTLTIAHLV